MKKIDIFDDENSIIIDDQYDTTDFTFYPEDKKFEVSRSVKDDAFYSNQTIEYKISANPVELQMRTLESSHEPPKEYSIRDGVVLESALKKNPLFPDRVEELKKEVEWSKIPIFGHYQINLFILSKHPEIISREDFRKFLRQSVERIKIGVAKVEEAVKADTHGLQFETGEYGRSIWYDANDKAIVKESDEYWKLPEEKRAESPWGKKTAYVEKFNKNLFDEDSPNYTGIGEYEFKSSSEIITYIEQLLDKKEAPVVKKAEVISQQNGNANTAKVVSIIIYLVTAFLVVLKLTDGVDWSWWAILAPILIWEGLGFLRGFLRALAK